MGERTGRPRGWIDDPAKRHARAVKAGEAARRAHHARAIERAKRFSPAAAYLRGDRAGYTRAYHYWRAWALRTVEQLTGQRLRRKGQGA